MFDNLKDLYNLKKQADEMQKKLSVMSFIGTSKDGRFSITLSGTQDMQNVTVPEGASRSEVEKGVLEAYSDARKKSEEVLKNTLKGIL